MIARIEQEEAAAEHKRQEEEVRAQIRARKLQQSASTTFFSGGSSSLREPSPPARRKASLERTPENVVELRRKISRLEGEQRVERMSHREGELDVLRYDLRRLERMI